MGEEAVGMFAGGGQAGVAGGVVELYPLSYLTDVHGCGGGGVVREYESQIKLRADGFDIRGIV